MDESIASPFLFSELAYSNSVPSAYLWRILIVNRKNTEGLLSAFYGTLVDH
jgi:hypothetical protein